MAAGGERRVDGENMLNGNSPTRRKRRSNATGYTEAVVGRRIAKSIEQSVARGRIIAGEHAALEREE